MPTSVWMATLYLPTLPRQYFLLKMHMHDFKRQSPHQSLTTQPSHSPLQGQTEHNTGSEVETHSVPPQGVESQPTGNNAVGSEGLDTQGVAMAAALEDARSAGLTGP